jgi:ubiquinone/menaquinone biosynthesis C-methylase UbiE
MPFDHFGLIAGFYDRVGKFNASEAMLGLLSLTPETLLLDVGGGTGRVAAALRGKAKNVIVTDISRGMLRLSADKDLASVCAPGEALPFSSQSIDRVIMIDALHHVLDQRQTARELWRVLAPNGRILIVEPNIHKISVKGIAIGEKLLLMRSHFLNGEQICSLFKAKDGKIEVLYEDHNVFICAVKNPEG